MKKCSAMGKIAVRHPNILKSLMVKSIHKSQNLTDFKKNTGKSKPANITFRITEKCNLRCSMCGFFGESGTWLNKTDWNELTLKDIESVIDNISPHRPMVTITGGEPFLVKDLFRMVGYITGKKMLCQIFTNGLLIQKNIDEIFESGLDILTVSIDGPNDLHDSVRNCHGLFNKIVTGIRAIQDIKKDKRSKKPLIAISFTITAMNHNRISEMADFANDLGIEIININHLVMTSHKEVNATKRMFGVPESTSWPIVEGFIASPDGINPDVVIEEIKGLYSKAKALILQSPEVPMEKIWLYYSNSPFRLRKQCYTPWFKVHIHSNGDVTPCSNFVIGNIRQESLKEIWHGKQMEDFRSKIRKHGKFPFCDRKCCDNYYKAV